MKRRPFDYKLPPEFLYGPSRTVRAIHTATRGVIVQPDTLIDGDGIVFHLTHESSGCLIRTGIESREGALYLAGALGGLPIRWDHKDPRILFEDSLKLNDYQLHFLSAIVQGQPTKNAMEYRKHLRETLENFIIDTRKWREKGPF